MANCSGISLSQTRVVFNEKDKSQTLTIKNSDKKTYLIQSRVQLTPDDTTYAPFIITPPLFKLPIDSRQVLRVLPEDTRYLPADRESLFYLSVLGIPAHAEKNSERIQVSMGLRFLIKLFYRPAGLIASQDATACDLTFSAIPQGVRVYNPTPYYHTLGELVLNQSRINLDKHPSMVAPMTAEFYSLSEPVTLAKWQTINDFGGVSVQCQQELSQIKETL